MTLHLAEHYANGRARYMIEVQGAPPLTTHRHLETLADGVPSIGDHGWITAIFACLDCAYVWVAVAPSTTSLYILECLRCGKQRSAPSLKGWCGSCGADLRIHLPEGAPHDGLECHVCHNMTAMVEVEVEVEASANRYEHHQLRMKESTHMTTNESKNADGAIADTGAPINHKPQIGQTRRDFSGAQFVIDDVDDSALSGRQIFTIVYPDGAERDLPFQQVLEFSTYVSGPHLYDAGIAHAHRIERAIAKAEDAKLNLSDDAIRLTLKTMNKSLPSVETMFEWLVTIHAYQKHVASAGEDLSRIDVDVISILANGHVGLDRDQAMARVSDLRAIELRLLAFTGVADATAAFKRMAKAFGPKMDGTLTAKASDLALGVTSLDTVARISTSTNSTGAAASTFSAVEKAAQDARDQRLMTNQTNQGGAAFYNGVKFPYTELVVAARGDGYTVAGEMAVDRSNDFMRMLCEGSVGLLTILPISESGIRVHLGCVTQKFVAQNANTVHTTIHFVREPSANNSAKDEVPEDLSTEGERGSVPKDGEQPINIDNLVGTVERIYERDDLAREWIHNNGADHMKKFTNATPATLVEEGFAFADAWLRASACVPDDVRDILDGEDFSDEVRDDERPSQAPFLDGVRVAHAEGLRVFYGCPVSGLTDAQVASYFATLKTTCSGKVEGLPGDVLQSTLDKIADTVASVRQSGDTVLGTIQRLVANTVQVTEARDSAVEAKASYLGGKLDYTVRPMMEPFGDALSKGDHEREAAFHSEARAGFCASLNARAVGCWGQTEHEAVATLLNEVAKMCAAGQLDDTGRPAAFIRTGTASTGRGRVEGPTS